MRKHFLKIATAVLGLAALTITAKGQAIDQLRVTVPYEFVVNGRTLPAGTYRVERVFDNDLWDLALTGVDNRSYAVVVSSVVEDIQLNNPHLTFHEIGGQHFLTGIETAHHTFTIPVAR